MATQEKLRGALKNSCDSLLYCALPNKQDDWTQSIRSANNILVEVYKKLPTLIRITAHQPSAFLPNLLLLRLETYLMYLIFLIGALEFCVMYRIIIMRSDGQMATPKKYDKLGRNQ